MLFNAHKSFLISDRSYISSSRKDIAKLAEQIGFGDEQKGKIDILVSEMVSNLIKHNAVDGEILVKAIDEDGLQGIEIICVDNGPGMHDLKRMMEDGVSTYGSKGEGLGAIKRMSDDFDIYSLAGVGTFILSRVFLKQESASFPIRPRKKTVEIKAVMVPKAGESLCGDGWAAIEKQDQLIVIATDGLGHGKDAHAASVEAINVFISCMICVPSEILKLIHNSIKKSRGIVGGIANINLKDGTLSYCGIGNIGGRIFSKEGTKSLISYNGTIGHNVPNTFKNHSLKWEPSNLLVLHSDGLKSRWDMAKYPGIERHDASLIAAILYKDNTRKRDDALVLIVRT
jgi:anti-sigma regulatory factor (Ser/Thr protein kinase)